MSRFFVLMGILLCLLRGPVVVAQGQTQVVVLRGMSAVPTEGSEWIALENTSQATISGQIWAVRDVQGSVKTWWIPALQPYELRMFASTETKISLNNTGDQVELLQGSVVVQSSAPYEELPAGKLWVLLSDGWQEMDVEEWDQRWPDRDWQVRLVLPSPTPQPSIVPTPVFSPSPVPSTMIIRAASSSSVLQSSEKPKGDLWWDHVALPTAGKAATQSALPASTPAIWERPPGNFDEEWKAFLSWKQEIWYRLGLTFFASFFTLVLCAPKLYRCYNDVCLFDDG